MAGRVYHWRDPEPIARVTLWAVAVSAVASASYIALDLYHRPDLAAEPEDLRPYTALDDLLILVLMATIVPGCIWLYRVCANARSWEPAMRHSPASAWLWFLVPVAHFFMPFRVLSEVYRVSGARSRTPLIMFWVINVISLASGYVVGFLTLRDLNGYGPFWTDIVSQGLSLAAHPFFAWMVIDLTHAQQDSTRIAEAFDDEAALPA